MGIHIPPSKDDWRVNLSFGWVMSHIDTDWVAQRVETYRETFAVEQNNWSYNG